MSTWSKSGGAVTDFEYPVAGANVGSRSPRPESTKAAAEEAVLRREAYARQLGRQEGEAAARADYEEAVKQQRSLLQQALAEFRSERERYFRSVEKEVVQLALVIARKVLQREAQFDPLLLRAVVRVALDKLQDETRVTLRATPLLADDWRRFIVENKHFAERVEVLADETVADDVCVIEASVGRTEIGVEAQLKEIEQGFFDLLARRPRTQG